MRDLVDVVREHMDITMSTKIDACQRNNGPTDLMPMMIWISADDTTNLAIVDGKVHAADYMPKALSLIYKQSPKVIIFMSESLGKALTSETELDQFVNSHQPGDLEKLHTKYGPLSGIQELIAFNAIDMTNGSQVQGILTFAYDDKGIPVFNEPDIQEIPTSLIERANISSIFNAFYKFTLEEKSNLN